MLTWSARRQLIYLGGVILFFVLVGLVFYFWSRPRPTCFDNIQNQGEVGVDCGGPCARVCTAQTYPMKVYWARPVPVRPGSYDVAALVENRNLDVGVRSAGYTIQLFDRQNNLVATKHGSTFINPQEKFLLFASNLAVGQNIIKTAFLTFDSNLAWEKAKLVPRNIYIERREFINKPYPRLHLRITNSSLNPINNIEVVSVLSDLNQTALGSSSTIIGQLKGGETKDVYMTWPEPFAITPSSFDTYWRVDTFGS